MKLTWKKIGSLFLAVYMVLIMMTMKAFGETGDTDPGAPLDPSGINTAFEVPDTEMYTNTLEIGAPEDELNLPGEPASTTDAANTIPVTGDVLQMEGGVLKDGVLVFDLGDYSDVLAKIEAGERIPITITRPKGGEAGYPVTAEFDLYYGSNNIGFKIFDTESGGDSIDRIEFPPNVTSKTIYMGEEYDYGDNTNISGTLSSYIYFDAFDKTTLDTPMIRLETTKAKSAGEATDGLMSVLYAQVGDATLSVKPGESKVIIVTFLPSGNIFQTTRAFCEITGDLTLNLKKDTETLALKPVEAVGSILSDVTFVIPPDEMVDEEWEVASITGIKNAGDGTIIDLTYSDVYDESNIRVSSSTFLYDNKPVFGTVATDKESYKGLESIQVSVPVQNADLIGFGAEDDYWKDEIDLSYDGGQSFIPQESISWNSATKSIEATFTAPKNNNSSALRIAVEAYRPYGDTGIWRGIFGAFKIIEISPEAADFIPIESITVTGIPASGIVCNNPYPLNVEISPENPTFSGYTWESGNPDIAQVTGGNLVFYEEGKVTITLRSEETAYRTEHGLPVNDDVLIKTFTFFAGAPRLISSSISVGMSDTATSVTARFNDNFDKYGVEWRTPALTYEIRKADGTIVESGNATKENDVTEVSLVFDDVTPKTVSKYENGEFEPAYTIKLTATAGTESVSATSNVYITPPLVTMECLTDTENVLVGEATTFDYRIGNLMPGYTLSYIISDGSSGELTESDKTTNPTTGLSTLTGSVSYTPPAQADASELKTITVTAQAPGQESQSLARRINVVDPDTGLTNVRFYDGLDGSDIDPEPGDGASMFYGLRESKIAALTENYDESSQKAIYEYVNRMIRPKTLSVTAPAVWGKMSTDVLYPTYNPIIPYALYRDQVGKEVTFSWENVPTTMKFTFNNDVLSDKVYVFYLKNTLIDVPVSVSYKTRNGVSVQKDVTPYNGYLFLYEPNGIASNVWLLQSSGSEVRYALAYPSGLGLSKSIPGYYNAEMLLTTLEKQHSYVISDPAPAFYTRNVTMSGEPTATFKPLYGLKSGAVIRYGVIDRDGKFIEGTGGELAIANNSSAEFQLPFKTLYENPGARLLVEYQFDDGVKSEPWAEYYDLTTLDKAFRNRTAIPYEYSDPRVNMLYLTSPKSATVESLDGQTQSVDITSVNKVLHLQAGDDINVSVATGKREISAATVTLKHYRAGDSMSEPRITTTAPVSVLNAGDWSFTPNHYATLGFNLTDYLTPGYFAQLVLQAKFTDGTTYSQALCYGMVDDNGSTVQNEQKILDILKGTDLFPTDQMGLRVKDADVKGHTSNVTVWAGYPLEKYRLSFDAEVAEVYDSINVKYASITSKNPFTWGVERKGDEYIVRGYVYDRGEGMQSVSNPESRRDFDFYFNDIKKNTDSIFLLKKTVSSIPHLIGYLEGKATITTGGEVRFAWNVGRMYAHNIYRTPQKNFKSGFFEWAIILAGEVRTFMEIQPPDAGGDPAQTFNFNLKEDSSSEITAITGHNGLNIEAGIYAQKEELRGKAEAKVTQKAVYRPYLANGGPTEKTIKYWTTGDLRLYRGYRVITDETGMSESGETTIPLWCASYWRRVYDVYGSNNDSLNGNYPQEWTVTIGGGTTKKMASIPALPSAEAASSLPSSAEVVSLGMPMLGAGISAQPKAVAPNSTARYYNFSDGADILTPGPGGIPNSAFGLDAASAEDGITVAAWGVHNDDYDTAVLDTFDEIGAQKYATDMTEIAAGVYSGGAWNIMCLTDNSLADVTPKTATNGSAGLVVWYQGTADVSDGYSDIDGVQPLVSIDEGRLMFARYDGSVWSNPAALYIPDSEGIADYSAAMAADGSAIVTAVTDSGRIVILRIASNGNVTLLGHSLTTYALMGPTGDGGASTPVLTRTSLVYNGKTYTLACFDMKNIALTLYDLSTEGFVSDTVFSGVPTNTNGEFRLFRDWAKTGTEAVVLMWPGSIASADSSGNSSDNSSKAKEAVIYASRMSAEAGGSTVMVCAPMTAFYKAGVAYIDSYDAYINGNTFSILTACKDISVDENGGISESGNAHVAEAQETFVNAISTYADVNDISNFVPGISTDLNVKVMNKGFAVITGITAQIDGGSSAVTRTNLQPNDEIVVTLPYTPVRDLPDSAAYTVTATFSDGSTATARGNIDLLQTDIAAQILTFSQENGKTTISALISNDTPFSIAGKTVVAGIYKDALGTEPVTDKKIINGSEFETQTMGNTFGAAVAANFTLTGADALPQTLYLIARVYDSSEKEIPDNNNMNNILTVTNIVLVSETNLDDNDDGDNSGGSSSGSSSGSGNTAITVTLEKTPDRSVTAAIPVTATAGANGSASATVPDKAITDAIAKALAEAEAQGKTANGTTVALNVTMPKGSTALTTMLTQSSLNSLVSAGVSQLELNGAPVYLGLDFKALQEIQKQSSGNISITIAPATGLSNEAKALLGNRPVYSITISYIKDGKTVNVTSLGSGTATLSIPYTPGRNEAVGYLFGVYVDGAGNAQRIPGSAYDTNSRSLLIPTGHFSVYGVGYTAPSARFTDIGTHWGKEAIDYTVGRGLLSGTSETTFAPNTAMTRGMLVTALGRLAGVDVKAYTTNSFTDVKADSVLRPYIEWAYKKGVVQGIGNQQFAPDRAVTREEIAVIFANYAKATGYKLQVTREATAYADLSSIGSVYKTAVTTMQQVGIMMGDKGNRFNPKSNATLAEVSTMLQRYIKLTIDPATAQGWALDDAGQYLYYKGGKAFTGTQTIDGVKYFFEADGTLKTGWVKDGDNWRYYSGNTMLVGWWYTGAGENVKTYYFDTYGNMVSGKWLQIDSKWYYFNAGGSLARSTKVDGYEVDENGVRKTK